MANGAMNMQNLLKQAQRAKLELDAAKAKLEESEFTAQAGGGAVSVTVSGAKRLKSISIKSEAADPQDTEMLGDMVLCAVNEALDMADKAGEALMSGIAGQMGGMF